MDQQLTNATNANPTTGSAPRGANRCRHRSNVNGRCRSTVQDPDTGLCFTHAARLRKTTGSFDDTFDLSTDLFGPATPAFQSAEEINSALSFILRGLQVIDQKTAGEPTEYVIDIDSAVARRALAAAKEREEREQNVPR